MTKRFEPPTRIIGKSPCWTMRLSVLVETLKKPAASPGVSRRSCNSGFVSGIAPTRPISCCAIAGWLLRGKRLSGCLARKKACEFAQHRMGMGARTPVAGFVGLPKADITHASEMVAPRTVKSCGITWPIQRPGISVSGFRWQVAFRYISRA
jgi:hypothetical protein